MIDKTIDSNEKSVELRTKCVILPIKHLAEKLPDKGVVTKSQLMKKGFSASKISKWESRGSITNVNNDTYSKEKIYQWSEVKTFLLNWGNKRGYPKGRPRKKGDGVA